MPEPITSIDGVEIFIVTYAKDAEWLQYCLRGIRKHLRGFQGVTVAHPNSERDTFARIQQAFGCRLYGFDEVPGKGFLHHQIVMASADLILPSATRYVMHLDADCIYKEPTVPSDYFHDGKPVYLWRTYDSLTTEDPRNPGSKVISDCAQWRAPTESQLGMKVGAYTMCRHPTVFPFGFYQRYRDHISKIHGNFENFMLSGRNEFPQSVMDFTAMGAFAFYRMHDDFHWINCGEEAYPSDRLRAYWSHGGTAAVREELERFVS